MKVIEVRATLIEVENAYRPGQGLKAVSNFIEVVTDDGIVGRVLTDRGPFGEGRARPVSEAIAEVCRPMICGRDPLDREAIWEMMVARSFGGTMMYAVGAIDLCLWDIAGKKAGMPLYKMLGGYRDRIRAYASTFSFDSPKGYADNAERLVHAGYTGIKLHLRGTYRDHIAAARAVREAVGEEVECFFDANCRYDRRTALIVGRALEELDYYWYEEPLPNSDLEGLRELCQTLDIPVSAAEEFFHVQPSHYTPFIVQHATDILRTDALLGITTAKKVMDMCDAFHVKCEPEGWGPATGQFATLHLAGCCRNTEFFEKTEPGEAYDVCVKNPIKIDRDGFVHMPEGTGLGVEFDLDEIKKRTLATF
jgi:L-alanine-DL-glutamate epimerase-like enolase superfamily enzyme